MYYSIAIYSLVVIAGIVSWIAGMEFRDTISFVGCTLAVCKIGVDLVKEIQEKRAKEEEKKEHVETSFQFAEPEHRTLVLLLMQVTLFNPSHKVPLRIKSVSLRYKEGSSQKLLSLFTNIRPSGSSVPFRGYTGDSSFDLEPRKSTTYSALYQHLTQAVCDGVASSRPDDLEIIISSHVGLIAQIDGRTVWDKMMEAERQVAGIDGPENGTVCPKCQEPTILVGNQRRCKSHTCPQSHRHSHAKCPQCGEHADRISATSMRDANYVCLNGHPFKLPNQEVKR